MAIPDKVVVDGITYTFVAAKYDGFATDKWDGGTLGGVLLAAGTGWRRRGTHPFATHDTFEECARDAQRYVRDRYLHCKAVVTDYEAALDTRLRAIAVEVTDDVFWKA